MNSADFIRIEKALRYLDANLSEQPDLTRVAAQVGVGEYHLQRLFRRWAGVSPKRFLQFATAERASQRLAAGESALNAAYGAGLSSPSRLHDLTIAVEAATPGEIKSGGRGIEIRWGVHPTPFGSCFVALTDRGICEMAFVEDDGPADVLEHMRRKWHSAAIVENTGATAGLVTRIFGETHDPERPLTVLLSGTNFQIQVWKALLSIPQGRVSSYGEVAESIDAPGAARAVGTAIGANRIAFLIPCHRVIRGTSAFGNYRWGSHRKKGILAWERALEAPEG